MQSPRLEAITVEGYLSIRSTVVELRDLNVLVGANGSGKSNLISVFELLGRLIDGELGLFVGEAGGASALLHEGVHRSDQVGLELRADAATYRIELTPAARDEFIIGQETLRAPGGGGFSVRHGSHEPYLTRQADHDRRSDASSEAITALIRGCRVFHFHDTSRTAPVKRYGYVSDNLALRSDAGNLAAFLLGLRTNHSASYRRIVHAVRQVAPFFRDFVLQPDMTEERIRLRWRQEGSDTVFPADALSDGTLRFICLATLLNQPEMPGLVVLDEPELGLHPYAIVQLAGMLRSASHTSQVLVATQSVTLMNQFALDDLIVADRQNGASAFSRPDPDRLREWLDDYSLGELWEKSLLGGQPQREG